MTDQPGAETFPENPFPFSGPSLLLEKRCFELLHPHPALLPASQEQALAWESPASGPGMFVQGGGGEFQELDSSAAISVKQVPAASRGSLFHCSQEPDGAPHSLEGGGGGRRALESGQQAAAHGWHLRSQHQGADSVSLKLVHLGDLASFAGVSSGGGGVARSCRQKLEPHWFAFFFFFLQGLDIFEEFFQLCKSVMGKLGHHGHSNTLIKLGRWKARCQIIWSIDLAVMQWNII